MMFLLSVNWLEFFGNKDRKSLISEVRQKIELKLGAFARFAVLNVGEVKSFVYSNSPDSRMIDIIHEPTDDDPSHSGIHKLTPEDSLIADLIAEIVQETFPAQEPE